MSSRIQSVEQTLNSNRFELLEHVLRTPGDRHLRYILIPETGKRWKLSQSALPISLAKWCEMVDGDLTRCVELEITEFRSTRSPNTMTGDSAI